MALRILDATTRAAVNAATTQQGVCEALIEPWAGGNVTARLFAPDGTTLLRTLTLGPFTINSATPRGVVAAAHQADTHVATGTPGLWVFRSGGTDIFSIDAGTSGASVNHAGNVLELCTPTLAGVVFTANSSLPVSPSPIDEALDLIAAAHANGQMWVHLNAGKNTITDVAPPNDLRDDSAGSPAGLGGMIYAWSSYAYDPVGHTLHQWGIGHANSSWNGLMQWQATNLNWRLGFHGSEMIEVNSGPGTHRSVDFNSTPASAHTYCNNVWLRVQGRLLTFGGSAYDDGNVLRVFDTGIPGDQPGLRAAGAFSLDVSQAGTGKVAGATGSNDRRGAYAGVDLDGADAWRLHDYFDGTHANPPIFGGTNYQIHNDRGAVATVEDGIDVVYYTAGTTFGLVRTEFPDSDPANDVSTLVCNGTDFNGDGEVLPGGNIAMDEVGRVVLVLAKGASSFQPFRFVDLDATTPAYTQPTSPTGVVSDLKGESKGEPGLFWDPIDQRFVAITRGSVSVPGVFPGSVYRIAHPARSGGFIPATGWAVDKRDASETEDLPPIGPWSGETFQNICGRVRWMDDMRIAGFMTGSSGSSDPLGGEIWGYIPENWTDPRLD